MYFMYICLCTCAQTHMQTQTYSSETTVKVYILPYISGKNIAILFYRNKLYKTTTTFYINPDRLNMPLWLSAQDVFYRMLKVIKYLQQAEWQH